MWSVHALAFGGKMDVADFIRYSATLPVQGVELLDCFWKDMEKEIAQVNKLTEEYGLQVACYAIGNNFVNTDADARRAEVQKVKDAVDVAKRLNTKVVRVFSGDATEGVEFAVAREWIIAGLKEGAEYAAQHGINLALENHGLFAGRAEQIEEIIREINNPYFGSTFDTGNFLLVNDEPTQAIKRLANMVKHVHVKDFAEVDASYTGQTYVGIDQRRFIGTVALEGSVDLRSIFADLRQANYSGWLSLEYEGPGDPQKGTEDSLNALAEIL
jgi:sugar phosphate isomerase/epimerase